MKVIDNTQIRKKLRDLRLGEIFTRDRDGEDDYFKFMVINPNRSSFRINTHDSCYDEDLVIKNVVYTITIREDSHSGPTLGVHYDLGEEVIVHDYELHLI